MARSMPAHALPTCIYPIAGGAGATTITWMRSMPVVVPSSGITNLGAKDSHSNNVTPRRRVLRSNGKREVIIHIDGGLFSFGLPLPPIVLEDPDQFLIDFAFCKAHALIMR